MFCQGFINNFSKMSVFLLRSYKMETIILLCIVREICATTIRKNTLNRFGFLVFFFFTGTAFKQIVWESGYYPSGISFHPPSISIQKKVEILCVTCLIMALRKCTNFLFPNLLKQSPGISVCLNSRLQVAIKYNDHQST